MAPNYQENEAAEELATTLTSLSSPSTELEAPLHPMNEEPFLLHRSLDELPHGVASASGSYLYLSDGRSILDACGGAAVAVIGHGNPEVIQAMVNQATKVAYIHTMAYQTMPAEDLARCILERREEDGYFEHGLKKAFFVGSGSEANDAGLKCARQYWFEKGELQRKWFVARKQAYHGNTVGAMSISNMPARKVPYEGITLSNVSFVGAADTYHRREIGETEEQFVERLVLEIETEFLRLGPENVISFIGETVSGAALGSMAAPKGYWPAVRALCDKYNIFAFTQEGIQPDIVTIGKGLGGGYAPIAGMLISGKIVDALRKGTSAFNHGQTYQAHPVSCATALAVQRIIKQDRLVSRCQRKGEKLGSMLREAFEGCEHVGDIRGGGLFWTLEFVEDRAAKRPFPKDLKFGYQVQQTAFEMGIAVYPGAGTVDGIQGDHVLLAPPYNVSDEELAAAVSNLKRAYEKTAKARSRAKL